jgi:hypothetical protein
MPWEPLLREMSESWKAVLTAEAVPRSELATIRRVGCWTGVSFWSKLKASCSGVPCQRSGDVGIVVEARQAGRVVCRGRSSVGSCRGRRRGL